MGLNRFFDGRVKGKWTMRDDAHVTRVKTITGNYANAFSGEYGREIGVAAEVRLAA